MLEGLRDLVLETNLAVHGVPATVTRPVPNDTPIETTVIWLTPGLSSPASPAYPLSHHVQKREVERVLVVSIDAVPELPRLSVISAPERAGGVARNWVVDSTEYADAEHRRVFVVAE